MRRFQLLFTFLQVPLDAFMVWGAFLLSYWARTQNIFASPATYMMPWGEYVRLTGEITLGWVALFALIGLYDARAAERPARILRRVFIAVSVGLAVFIVVLFGIKETFFSRLIAAYVWVLAIILVFLGRWLLLVAQWVLARAGIIRENIIVIGDTEEVAAEIKKFYEGRLATVRLVSANALKEASAIEALVNQHQTDQVIVAGELAKGNGLNLQLINFCEIHGIRFRYVPSLTELHSLHVVSEVVHGYPVIELKPTPLDGWGRIVKRFFDFIVSAIALIILSPVMILIAVLIKLDSPGPALFVQRRPGQFGKEFWCYKFRSMYTHLSTGEQYGGEKAEALRAELKAKANEADGVLFKMKQDPRVTKMGQFLRKTSLDELPQLFNILDGEMSLVGPRPPLLDEVAEYEDQQFRRLMVKPGLTGMWQVSGRSDSTFNEYMKLDMYYIEHWSLWLDIQIILKTVWVVINRKGAY